MKFLGHPIHVMLIHFPSALFPMDLVCSLIGYYSGDTSFATASFYAMCGGVLLGFLAIVTGTIDLIAVLNKRKEAVKRTLLHGLINTTVVCAYSVFAFIAFNKYPEIVPDSLATIIMKGVLVAFMLAGNYFGGSLVLEYGIGVQKQNDGNKAI